MNTRGRQFVCAAALLAALAVAAGAAVELSDGWKMQEAGGVGQSGEVISTSGFSPAGWYAAIVPGTVLTTLVANKVYPEPFFGENLKSIPETLNKSQWWYRLEFDVPAVDANRRVWLTFEGINYKAEIYLNGKRLGEMKGAFIRGFFDATGTAVPGEKNYLAVKIYPNEHPGSPHLSQSSNCGPNCGSRDIGIDGPTFLATLGWDWTPGIPDRDIGIWQEVNLSSTGPVVVRDPFVAPDLPLPELSPAKLTVTVDLKNAGGAPVTGTLEGSIVETGGSFQVPVALAAGESKTVSFSPDNEAALVITDPLVWWPNGYGPQNLYHARFQFVTGSDVSDDQTVQFGVREFEYVVTDILTVKCNGYNILCKGGSWGMDEAMKRMPRERFKACIRLHHDANFTMIRNWVGMTDDPDFYDYCDKYGILVWDDFWLSNAGDCAVPADNALFLKNAEDKIRRYRNHPSECIWCGRNESEPPAALNSGMQNLVQQLDGTRRYQVSSLKYGVHGQGPYHWDEPENYFTSVAWGFTTEVGPQCVPSAESMRAMMPADKLWPRNDTWGFHDFCYLSWIDVNYYINALDSRYGSSSSIDEYCKKAQLLNMETFKALFEAWGASLFDDCTGVLLWMSNASWPNLTWQLYDNFLEGTGAYYGAMEACEPLHIEMNVYDRHVVLVNTTADDASDLTATATVYNADGTEKWKKSQVAAVASNTTEAPFYVEPPADVSSVYFVVLTLTDAAGTVISDNRYWRSTTRTNFTAINSFPKVSLEGEATDIHEGTTHELVGAVTNGSAHVALQVRLKTQQKSSGARVLPAYYDDNYFILLPQERKEFTVEFDDRYLGGDTPKLLAEAFNADETEIPITKVGVRPRTAPTAAARPVVTQLTLYDLKGRRVAQLDAGQLAAAGVRDTRRVDPALRSLACDGFYVAVCRMSDQSRVVVRKCMLAR